MKRNGMQLAIRDFFFRERASKEVVTLLPGYMDFIIAHHKKTQNAPTKPKQKTKPRNNNSNNPTKPKQTKNKQKKPNPNKQTNKRTGNLINSIKQHQNLVPSWNNSKNFMPR